MIQTLHDPQQLPMFLNSSTSPLATWNFSKQYQISPRPIQSQQTLTNLNHPYSILTNITRYNPKSILQSRDFYGNLATGLLGRFEKK